MMSSSSRAKTQPWLRRVLPFEDKELHKSSFLDRMNEEISNEDRKIH